MSNLELEANQVFNIAVYLQMMAAFDNQTDFLQIKEIVLSTHELITKSTEEELTVKLTPVRKQLEKIASLYKKRYPPKKDIDELAAEWNSLFNSHSKVFDRGVPLGWLHERMDISRLTNYSDYIPYHLQVGLVAHKGFFSIEEDFLLKDAYNILVKAEITHDLLKKYGGLKADGAKSKGQNSLDVRTYKDITDIKFEIAGYSRLTVVSFYAFLECFVNSIGYSYLQYNSTQLSVSDKEILQGKKNGRYLSLRSKIERFQQIIRKDKRPKFLTTDVNQTPEFINDLFTYYEALRNSSVHFSPEKEEIWLKPDQWLSTAQRFAELTLKVALEFWLAAMDKTEGPKYLGKLDNTRLYNQAKYIQQRLSEIRKTIV